VELPGEAAEEATPVDPEPVFPPSSDSVPEVEVPVEVLGSVTVHAEDERLLAVLLERFGAGRSFVRERSWTMVLPAGGNGGGRPPER